LRKIVLSALPFRSSEDIIEIGPGPGGLTREIIKLSDPNSRVFCIEKDETMKQVHASLKSDRTEFIYEDAMMVSLNKLTDKKIVIISNLPYNVGTKLLLNWLHNDKLVSENGSIDRMVLMFQKEVADRITSQPASKTYGRLSIIVQLLCKCEKLFDVSNKAFFPPPRVVSSVIKLTPKGETILNISYLEKITAICFQQRRKTMFSSLKNQFDSNFALSILNEASINPNSRPEVIAPTQFLHLANVFSQRRLYQC
jgi:16S rRNA (adenine1518-N6/adenine1519-N6)-dimethyltransferase